ncbi:MAG: glycogen debranching protein [Flavobacteriaceae bacterium]
MRIQIPILICLWVFVLGCTDVPERHTSFNAFLESKKSIAGKAEYLQSPYVTAGDRVYMVGHQDGSFPDLGWHIKGEMGGIWNHPIKLMDGFDASISVNGYTHSLNQAATFVNYPMANSHQFNLREAGLEVERWQFVPDGKEGLYVQFEIGNTLDQAQDIHFTFTGHSDLRPTWLGEETGMFNGQDKAHFTNGVFSVKDSLNNWFVLYGSSTSPSGHRAETLIKEGKGTSGSLIYDIRVPAKGSMTIGFVIAGSHTSEATAKREYFSIQKNWKTYLNEKKERYAHLAEKTKLTIPDKQLQQTFEWLKYNCDWLVRTVPEIGSGIGAGIPDYPWWFGVDSEYALRGYMAVGQTDPVYHTIKLLDSVSMAVNGNGRIIHEMSTNGKVFNPGNINETPQFASLIWEIYTWNGDKKFLKKYFPTIKKGLKWLMEENDANGNLFPDGFGMMEIHGLNSEMIDVASYTQRAFADAAKIAHELGESALGNEYGTKAAILSEKINTRFWSPQFRSFADFLGTDSQALHLIEDAIVRADTLKKPWAVAELKQTQKTIETNPSDGLKPFVLHHNWVVNTPMEMGIADQDKALEALETAKKFTNPFGVFVTGIDRDKSAGQDDGSFSGSKVFSYTGAVMTLPTGVQAVAENNYGRPDQALDYLNRMARSFSYAHPGSMYEVSPDYGMLVQAWNIYAFAIPIVQQFFGIGPMASQNTITIAPQMPSTWDNVSLENVVVGDNSISIHKKSDAGKTSYHITQTQADWTLQLILPITESTKLSVVRGNVQKQLEHGQTVLLGSGTEIEIELEEN